MNKRLEKIIADLDDGVITQSEACKLIQNLTFENLGFARVDHHREIRCGFPEVILCQGKTTGQILAIVSAVVSNGCDLLATRADEEIFKEVLKLLPDAQYNKNARTITLKRNTPTSYPGYICIVCAGTSDIPVAEEAKITCQMMDNVVKTVYDVGVAGIHRLMGSMDDISSANVIIVVAGMEGALPSVVGGMVDKPVIAVPTSVGYGASFNGLAALLTMLNSCASGVTVVNIDNGFGAGYAASLINRVNVSKRDAGA